MIYALQIAAGALAGLCAAWKLFNSGHPILAGILAVVCALFFWLAWQIVRCAPLDTPKEGGRDDLR